MSQSALAALLGSKPAAAQPSQTPKPTSAPAATPAAPPAASAPPPATIAPAAAAAPSAPSPAPAIPAPGRPEPGPNAAAVATPQGGPPDTLAALLGDFKANVGKAPQVNPPQAAAVLAGPAAAEVAGHPEPPEVKEAVVSPVAKPAEVLAAEQAPKSRRTAAVVQVELDAALKRVAELEATLASAAAGAEVVADPADKATIAEAVELIQSMRGEAAIQLDDNRKAWARVAELEEQLAKAAAPLDGPLAVVHEDVSALSFQALASELQSRLDVGQTFTLTGQL